MTTRGPIFAISAAWFGIGVTCETVRRIIVPSESSNDSSTFPTFQQDPDAFYRVFSSVFVELAPGSHQKIKDNEASVAQCHPWGIGVGKTETVPTVDGFVGDQFVSAVGKLPGALDRGRAIAAGLFASGVLHVYSVDAIPVVRALIVKTNVVVARVETRCDNVQTNCF
jgi:hypothetical protein